MNSICNHCGQGLPNPAPTRSRYQVLSKLGSGSNVGAFRAVDRKSGNEVALKILLPAALSDNNRTLKQYQWEAKVLAKINHPNIASHVAIEDVDTLKVVITELLDGDSLESRLREGSISIDEAIAVFHQVAKGLGAAHEQGVIHRNLKPRQIHITTQGIVKVIDFRLAQCLRGATSKEALSGAVIGTPAYMSPEQTRGEALDERTDVWAFGCCLFESLTGQKPFNGESVADLMKEVLESDPDFNGLPAETPSHVRSMLPRCLEKNPDARLRDLNDIAQWLR